MQKMLSAFINPANIIIIYSQKTTVYWNFFTEWIIILIWEHAAAVWLFTENMDLTVPSTTLRIHLSVQNLTEMWVL